jgi:hypothetical protein
MFLDFVLCLVLQTDRRIIDDGGSLETQSC